jgi:hypothetical protein
MSLDNPKGIESSVSKNTEQRRKFLKRTAAGAVIASIPGRSAWAGMAGSIVASGHGSDWNDGGCTELLSAGYWMNHQGNWGIDPNKLFSAVFLGDPIHKDGVNTYLGKTMKEVIENPGGGGNGLGGPSNVNFHMVAMYLNASNHGSYNIYYPAATQHGSLSAYASYLYNEASLDPSAVGVLLGETIDTYHVGTSNCL